MAFLKEPLIDSDIQVLVIVNSHPSELELRNAIRQSWAHKDYYQESVTKIIFILGRPATEELEEAIDKEFDDHNDILIADMKEDYYLLSIKTFAMLYYKKTRFPSTKCLVKADSDNVLNLANYERLCMETVAPRIVGTCTVDTTVIRTGSKWAVPWDIYPNAKWPIYCSSGTYVFCGHDVAERLLEAAEDTPFFTSNNFRKLPEDALFTGLLAEKAGIRRKHVGGMSFRDDPIYLCRDYLFSYSVHMHKDKSPLKYHRRLISFDGIDC